MEEGALLRAWVNEGNSDALAQLQRSCAASARAACLRITKNAADADDVAQECLIELARDAAKIRPPVGPWIKARATSRAQNLLRDRAVRRKHETIAPRPDRAPADDGRWAEVSPLIDEAIERLPQDLRASIVLCYLEGQSQQGAAVQLGVNQATLSRRLNKGVIRLRRELKTDGVTVSPALLLLFLGERMIVPAPASFMAAVGRIAAAAVSERAGAGAPSDAAAGAKAAAGTASNSGVAGASAAWTALTVSLAALALSAGVALAWLNFGARRAVASPPPVPAADPVIIRGPRAAAAQSEPAERASNPTVPAADRPRAALPEATEAARIPGGAASAPAFGPAEYSECGPGAARDAGSGATGVAVSRVRGPARAADKPGGKAEAGALQGESFAAPIAAANEQAADPQAGTTDAAAQDAADPSGDSNSDSPSQPPVAPAPVHKTLVQPLDCHSSDPVFVQFTPRDIQGLRAARARYAAQKAAALNGAVTQSGTAATASRRAEKSIPTAAAILESILEKK